MFKYDKDCEKYPCGHMNEAGSCDKKAVAVQQTSNPMAFYGYCLEHLCAEATRLEKSNSELLLSLFNLTGRIKKVIANYERR